MSSHHDSGILGTIVGFIELAIELAWPLLTVILLVMAYRISSDKTLTLKAALQRAINSLKTIIGQRFILFFCTTLFVVAEQICHQFVPLKSTASDLGWGLLSGIGVDPLRMLFGAASFVGWIICQYIVFLDNMLDDQSIDQSLKHDKMSFVIFVVANMSAALAIVFGSFLLLVPGLFFSVILWVVPAVSICEKRGMTAIARCFVLADKEFWTLCKVVLPFTLALSLTASLPEVLALMTNAKIVLNTATALGNIIAFLLNVLSWQCQYDLYKYLVKSNGGEQDDTATKISQPQT